MLGNKRKIRLCALSSIVYLQADPPGRTLRARRYRLHLMEQPMLGVCVSGPLPVSAI